MLLTNINLTDGKDPFQYVIEYVKTDYDYTDRTNPSIGYVKEVIYDDGEQRQYIDDIMFVNMNDASKPIKFNNDWYNVSVTHKTNLHIPNSYNFSNIRLYFPKFSVDTYLENISYALTVGTWICGRYIVLGSYIINRSEALACPGVKTFYNEQYHEYIELPIIDPMDLIYSDAWSDWRKNVCGESSDPTLINSVGSVLYCTLYAVHSVDNGYVKNNIINGGQNSIGLTNITNDFLNLSIFTNINRSLNRSERPAIECNIGFNKYYNGDFGEYMKETYGVNDFNFKYELVVYDNDVVYVVCESPILVKGGGPITSYTFTKDDINKNNFENGNGWKYGMNIRCSFEVMTSYDEPLMCLISNTIPLTEKLFSYLVKTDFRDSRNYLVNNVNLDDVDMKVYNINAVNKTVNEIVQIDRRFDNKSSISQTMFYRVTDNHSIILHPEVTENICINLDQYKHLVKTFILQIEGIKFIEIGRVQSGIMFKVIGNKLPKQTTSGLYYILNQDSDVVTNGKYTYTS